MATTDSTNTAGGRTADHIRRANPMGAHVATAGIVVFLIATYLDWVSTDGEQSATGSGYETDTSIALVAFVGVGLAPVTRRSGISIRGERPPRAAATSS